MNQKIGRNDPCRCGSGKKYKNCCQKKDEAGIKTKNHKITAKWLNAPQAPNLMERTFGEAIAGTARIFEAKHEDQPSKGLLAAESEEKNEL